ncbi:hypothetical protein ACIBBD_32555 [Streptomyces sp. NPDC051315]|uniref:hypothetical protein n=1 Tax=Streptomyces sp. NPDC051315 TaxID=3365650 RepID=UPI0037B3E49D
MTGVRLYVRSRVLPRTLAGLAGTAGLVLWAASGPAPGGGMPVLALAPLLAAALIGTSLYAACDELDRTAVRPWWPRRLVHLLGLTAPMAVLLPLAVLGGDGLAADPWGMVRNLLGCTGLTAAAAVLLGARLSWLPACGYVWSVYLASEGVHGHAVTVWAWPTQPGHTPAAWLTAAAACAAGTALYAARGARPEGPRT